MHFYEFTNTKDKIIHLLLAAYAEGMYGMAIVECTKEFGEEITSIAVKEFKENYKRGNYHEIEVNQQDLEQSRLC